MRLFHVSEESDIKKFEPRFPTRSDLDPKTALVWAIDEKRLPNFLAPRDCPRVTYHVSNKTTEEDKKRFLTSPTCTHVIIIENQWFKVFRNTTLYLYEFDDNDFTLQDDNAGYYVSTVTQSPKRIHVINDVVSELLKRNVELRITDNLRDTADAIKTSTLNWSLCRMGNALPRII